ncbi:MAG: Catabolite control protein A [Candidatus Izimaplasma bacterium HR2]|nr:MAG: Catabolite control protein A [Candidatus Izimaplasma bacterium HR2]
MTTIKDVAKLAGVSISTASYALNDSPKVSKKTKERILRAGKELNYYPNGNARNLKNRKTGNVGVFIYEFAGPIFSDVLDGIHKRLQESGLNIIVSSGTSSVNLLLERQVDAAVIFDDRLEDVNILHYGEMGYPVFVLDRNLKGKNIYSSKIDNESLVKDFIQKKIKEGYSDFGYLSGPLDSYNNNHRFIGFKQALESEGIKDFQYFQGNFTIHGGFDVGVEIAESKDRPSFVFCANDESAIGLIQGLKSKGISIPGDVAVAGFDNITLCDYIDPTLTTIGIDHYSWGKRVAESIIAILKKKKPVDVYNPIGSIIQRESC